MDDGIVVYGFERFRIRTEQKSWSTARRFQDSNTFGSIHRQMWAAINEPTIRSMVTGTALGLLVLNGKCPAEKFSCRNFNRNGGYIVKHTAPANRSPDGNRPFGSGVQFLVLSFQIFYFSDNFFSRIGFPLRTGRFIIP